MNELDLTVVENHSFPNFSIRTTRSNKPLSADFLSDIPLENGEPVFFAIMMHKPDTHLLEMDRAGAAALLAKLEAFGDATSGGQAEIRDALRKAL